MKWYAITCTHLDRDTLRNNMFVAKRHFQYIPMEYGRSSKFFGVQ